MWFARKFYGSALDNNQGSEMITCNGVGLEWRTGDVPQRMPSCAPRMTQIQPPTRFLDTECQSVALDACGPPFRPKSDPPGPSYPWG